MIYALAAAAALNLLLTAFILLKISSKPRAGGREDTDSLSAMVKYTGEAQLSAITRTDAFQRERLEDLERRIEENTRTNELRLGQLKEALENNIRFMSAENARQLEAMRAVVDEKLSDSLEKRLNKSFELISGRLEAVYKGIGEVQSLAGSVSDIKKIFTNVKTRGSWGEVHLESMLEQVIGAQQYEKNVRISPLADERVDFALKIPSKDDGFTYLPVDSKFPVEEFFRLSEAADSGDKALAEQAGKGFERRIKEEADKIARKYIMPPKTTDFALMYLPSEAVYAETIKRGELMRYLHEKRVMPTGPNNLGAMLCSLQAGFKSITIEKRSAELWKLLSAFKLEFSRFTELLIKTQKKLQEAQDTIDSAAKKTRTIERKLSGVKEIEETEQQELDYFAEAE